MGADVVVALVKVDRDAAAGVAVVLDDALGQGLDLATWEAASTLEKSTYAAVLGVLESAYCNIHFK